MTNKKPLFLIAGLAVLTFFAFLFGWQEVTTQLSRANPAIMAALFILQIVTLALTSLQWQFMLRKAGYSCSGSNVFLIILAGNYVESVTPAAKLGGESAKLYLFKRLTSLPGEKLAGILLALKYFSLLPFLILTTISFGLASWRYQLPVVVPGAFIFLVIFFAVIWWLHKKTGQNKTGLSHAPKSFQESIPGKTADLITLKYITFKNFISKTSDHSRNLVSPLEQLAMVAVSTLIWLLYPLKVYIICRMLSLEIDLATVTMVTFTAYMISMVPLLPGGLGSFEVSMTLLLSLSGIHPAYGLSATLLSRLVTYWFPLILSAFASAFIARTLITGFPGNSKILKNSHPAQSFAAKKHLTGGKL